MNCLLLIKRLSATTGILLTTNLSYSCPAPDNDNQPDSIRNTKELNELVVEGVGSAKIGKIGRLSMSGDEINRCPVLLGEHDVIKALQSSAGVVSGTEGFAGLYVRGGETDQNLYLLDGMPLLNVYHFGGLFSSFCTYSVENVDFYKGAFPASFGDRASSIVDVALKKPNLAKTEGAFSIGLISGQLYISTPLRKNHTALSVSLRRTWLDVFSAPALAIINSTKKAEGRKSLFHYNFTDLMVKFRSTDGRTNDLSMLLFLGKDRFKLGEELFYPDKNNAIYKRDVNTMSWGNRGLILDYRLTTPMGVLKIQPYLSMAFASDSEENFHHEKDSPTLEATTKIEPSVFQTGIRESFRFPISNRLQCDVGLQQSWYDYNVGNPTVEYSDATAASTSSPYPGHFRNWLLAAFGELQWNIGTLVHGSAGLRVNRFISNDERHWNLEPRFELRVEMPYQSGICLGFTRVSQYAQQISSNYMYLPSDAWLPTASHHKPLECDIYSLGYFKRFDAGFNVKGELWYKNMQNLAEFKPNVSVTATALPWYEKITFGKGRAYGLDLEMHGQCKPIYWNIGYGLMWNRRKFDLLNGGNRYPAKFDNRHKVDVGVTWKINSRLELTGQWEYMTGNRTTLALYNVATPDYKFPDAPFLNPISPEVGNIDGMDFYENRNNIRLPDFHRLNLNLTLNGRINGQMTYKWDFGLYNAYCRMNPFTITKSYVTENWNNKRDYRHFKTLGLLPILPSVSFTLNF